MTAKHLTADEIASRREVIEKGLAGGISLRSIAKDLGVSSAAVCLFILRHMPELRATRPWDRRQDRKLTQEQVLAIAADNRPYKAIAAEYGIASATAKAVIRGHHHKGIEREVPPKRKASWKLGKEVIQDICGDEAVKVLSERHGIPLSTIYYIRHREKKNGSVVLKRGKPIAEEPSPRVPRWTDAEDETLLRAWIDLGMSGAAHKLGRNVPACYQRLAKLRRIKPEMFP